MDPTKPLTRPAAAEEGAVAGHPLPKGEGYISNWEAGIILVCLAAFAGGCGRRHSAPKAYAAFVANNGSSTLAEVDLASFRVRASVPVAARPERIVVRPQSKELWVVTGSGEVSIVGFPALRVVRNLHIGEGARDLTFSTSGHQGFILDPGKGQIVFIDAEDYKERTRLNLGTPLTDLALTPDGNTLVASSRASDQLFFVEVVSRKVLGSVKSAEAPVQWLSFLTVPRSSWVTPKSLPYPQWI